MPSVYPEFRFYGRRVSPVNLSRKVDSLLHALYGSSAFAHPAHVLWQYITNQSPQMIELKNGSHFYLSSHREDLITAVGVFARKEYGQIRANSVVVDIGANIGAFSVFAAQAGAASVYAYEPNPYTYRALTTNISAGKYHNVVFAHPLAVVGQCGLGPARLTIQDGPRNHLLLGSQPDLSTGNVATAAVETTCLVEIVEGNSLAVVDTLKLDCEGAEYEILAHAPPALYQKIKEIKLEYHHGRFDELKQNLSAKGFVLRYHRAESASLGIAFFANESYG